MQREWQKYQRSNMFWSKQKQKQKQTDTRIKANRLWRASCNHGRMSSAVLDVQESAERYRWGWGEVSSCSFLRRPWPPASKRLAVCNAPSRPNTACSTDAAN
jgi:hypothetical protein